MGQYYIAVFLAEDGKTIRAWMDPTSYSNGSKLTEHSFLKNHFMNAVEYALVSTGLIHKCKLVWAGDYADNEEKGENLYRIAHNDFPHKCICPQYEERGTYIVNHTKKLYIDKSLIPQDGYIIHPLSLLVSEGNGKGGGDYFGINEEECGKWARDTISIESTIEDGFTRYDPHFSNRWA